MSSDERDFSYEEDLVPSTSHLQKSWPSSGKHSWTLEVREFFQYVNHRIGEVVITGRFDDELTLSIRETEQV